MKRLLSMFLVLAMVVGILPAVSVASAEAAEPLKITYDLAAHMTASGMTFSAGRDGTAPDLATIDYDYTNGFYKIHSSSYENHKESNLLYRGKYLENRCSGKWVSFEIYVPITGTYDLSTTIHRATNAGKVEVYVDSAENYTSYTNLVTTYDCRGGDAAFGSNTPGVEETIAEGIGLSKGKHIITFRAYDEENSSSNQIYGSIGSFSLSCADISGSFLMGAVITGFDGGKVNLQIGMSNGDVIDASEMEVTYKSSDESVVTVDNEGNITEVAPGRAVISATVTVGEDSCEASKEYSIKGFEIIYDLAAHMAASGMTFSAGKAGTAPDLATIDYDYTNGFYKIHSSSYENHKESNMLYRGKYLENRCSGKWVSFEIYVPITGTYDLSTVVHRATNAGKVEVYVDSAENYTSYTKLVTTYDCRGGDATFGSSTPGNEETIAKDIELSKGKHIITFRAYDEENSSSNQIYGSVSSFTLSSDIICDPIPMTACIKSDSKTVVEGGGITKVSAEVYLSDGTAVAADSVKLTALTPEYATYDETFGVIIGKTVGTAKFSAEVSYGNEASENEFSIEVVENIARPGEGEVITYDIHSRINNEQELNGPESFGGLGYAALTYASNSDLWEYAANKTNGVFSWQEGGLYYATYDDKDYTRVRTNSSSGGVQMKAKRDSWFAIKIKVPYTGWYFPAATYWRFGGRGAGAEAYMDYFLFKNDGTDVSTLLGSADLTTSSAGYIGSKSSVDSELSSSQSYVFDEPFEDKVKLDEGEYYLVYKPRNVSGSSNSAVASDFTLDGVNCVKEVYVNVKTDIDWNEETQISVLPIRLDGTAVGKGDYTVTYSSLDKNIATVSEKGVIKGIGDGPVTISVTVSDGIGSVTKNFTVNVNDNTGMNDVIINIPEKIYVNQKILLDADAVMNSGNILDIPESCVTYSVSSGEAVIVSEGMLSGVSEGSATVTTNVDFRGKTLTFEKEVTVIPGTGKTEPNIYTYEMRKNARNNIAKYDWAKTIQKNAIKEADKVLETVDILREQILGEGIPRGRQVGAKGDDYYVHCRYCYANIDNEYEHSFNFAARPWKVQCSACKRLFPSNDFESFLKLGLDETGYYFDVDRARTAHHKMLFHADGSDCTCTVPAEANTPEWYIFYGYGNPEGYLYNDLYEEIRDSNTDPWGDKITWNGEAGADLGTYKDPETGETLWRGGDMWAVDDGWGYLPGRTYADGIVERHGYIARYNYGFWREIYSGVVTTLGNAYLYTGDEKYGLAGARFLDRIADVWNSFDGYYFRNKFVWTDGGSGYGAVLGRINDNEIGRAICYGVDTFYPMITNDKLIRELSADAEMRGLENKKSGSEEIWRNWADGICITSANMCMDGRINGNYGQAQAVAALAAIGLHEQPKTDEIISWLYKSGGGNKREVTGGNFEAKIINDVDRDGMGNEASPRYNSMWIQMLNIFAEALTKYDGTKNYNPYENPKFVKMFDPQMNMLLTNSKFPNIGDSGSPASITTYFMTIWGKAYLMIDNEAYKRKLAQYLYHISGGDLEQFGHEIFESNPEGIADEMMLYVDEDKEQESNMLTGWGFAALRDGNLYKSASASTETNNLRDFWMWFGNTSASHGHKDALNIGIDAFGLDVAPDLGYPEDTSYTPNRLQWVNTTISHNTVMVDKKAQGDVDGIHGYPYHFDDSGKVKLMDADMKSVYPQTDNYRRTVVMVEANDDVAYGVDFFRVTGGNHHLFSFHSQAENAYPVSGIELTPDPVVQDEKGNDIIGSYAGPDAPFGKDPWTQDAWEYETFYPRGYTYLKNVRRDASPEAQFTVEFDVQDYRKTLTDGKGIKLRMTQFNNFTPTEVAIAGGYMTVKTDTLMMPDTLDYVLVEREGEEGESLDSLFTTVYEPYRNTPYIEEITPVDIAVKSGDEADGDTARAVKVKHTEANGGNTDYIVYTTNKDVEYTVTDGDFSFDFSGFVGVYTLNANGACIYRYVNDGTIIGEETGKVSAYSGTVTGFQKENAFENYIDVEIDCTDLGDLAGKYIYVNNDGVQNGAYQILSATDSAEGLEEGSVRLDVGTVTLIRGHVDQNDLDKGYVYNIKEGQTFSIPTAFVDESVPEFESLPDSISTSAGSSISVNIRAKSPIEEDTPTITYIGTTLPRGASLNSETGVLTWKPDSSQVGENHVAVTARDSDGRESIIHFEIAVYGNTTPNKSEVTETPSTDNTDTPSGGGGGGGGGGAAPETSDKTNTDEKNDESLLLEEKVPSAGEADEVENVRFTDLDNHSWAADAINALADDGIAKGTTASTFSPAANITRADFALLLVRAFKLESDNAENFADVSASDYFASELAIARNTGIVNGIGDNKFAPRNTITRQDMMVIVYRALSSIPLEEKVSAELTDEVLSQYPDFTNVADYAKDAVSALISEGLVNGKSGRIAPTDYTTRAEVAVLVKRMLELVAR